MTLRKPKNKKQKIAYAMAEALVDAGMWCWQEEPILCESCDSEVSEFFMSSEEIEVFYKAFQAASQIK